MCFTCQYVMRVAISPVGHLSPLVSLPLCGFFMNSGYRPWLHSRAPPQITSSFSSSSCFHLFLTSNRRRLWRKEVQRHAQSERPGCPGVPQWPRMALHEGLHTQAYTRTHRGWRCEGPDSVRSIVYNRFTYPQAECDPHSRHHTSLPFSLTNPHTLSCA